MKVRDSAPIRRASGQQDSGLPLRASQGAGLTPTFLQGGPDQSSQHWDGSFCNSVLRAWGVSLGSHKESISI